MDSDMNEASRFHGQSQASERLVLERVYREHKDRLLTLAACLTGDRHSAEDVVHDVFRALIKDGAGLRENSNLHAYLTVCTRNRAIDMTRRHRTRNLAAAATAASQLNVDDPLERAAESEETAAVLQAVNELPPEQREVLSLHVWGDLPFEEIGRLQGISKGAAYARYRSALEKLRVRLRSKSYE